MTQQLIEFEAQVRTLTQQLAGRGTQASSSPRSSNWSLAPRPEQEEEEQRVECDPQVPVPPPPPAMAPPPPLPAPQQPQQGAAPLLPARPQFTEHDFYYTDHRGWLKCKLCSKYVDANHLESDAHLRRAAHPYRAQLLAPP